MSFRLVLSKRNREIRWALVYALYLLTAVGLVISASITARHGNDFFQNTAAAQQNMITLTQNGGGEQGMVVDPATGEQVEAGVYAQQQLLKHNALVRSSVISSVGVAMGAIVIILAACTLGAHALLAHRWQTRPLETEYSRLVVFASVTSVLNALVLGGGAGLAAGFALTADEVRRTTAGTLASTPSYLVGGCVMSAVVALMAGLAVAADVRKCREARAEVEGLVREQSPGRGRKGEGEGEGGVDGAAVGP